MREIEYVNPQVEVAGKDIRSALLLADKMREELVATGDWLQLCVAIEGLKKIKADLDTLIRSCEHDAANLLPEKKVSVDGFGVIEKRTSTSRKWESEDLLMTLCRSILDPEGTGEIQSSRVPELIRVLKSVMPLTASLGWRVTALKELGIDPDSFSELTFGRQSVQITS